MRLLSTFIFGFLITFSLSSRLLSETRQPANRTNITTTTTNTTTTTAVNVTQPRPQPAVRTIRTNITAIINPIFYTTKNGKPGKDFIALKSRDGFYMGCNSNGNIIFTNTKISKNELWLPVMFNRNQMALRSNNTGGVLRLIDSTFDCVNSTITKANVLNIAKNLTATTGMTITNFSQTLAFQINNKFLSVLSRRLRLADNLSDNTIFRAPWTTRDLTHLPAGRYQFERANLPS